MDGWYWSAGLQVAIIGTPVLMILTNFIRNVRKAMKEGEK